MIKAYVPVLLLIGFVIANAALMLGLSALTLRARPTPVKQTPYESGIPPLGSARERFSIKFYMVAISFIIFDVETVFLFPWAVIVDELALFGLIEMIIFLAILVTGYAYAWKKGALDWA